MERENKKRERHQEDQWKNDSETNAKKKKQELICFDDLDFCTITDSFRPLGVFDFPWLKENRVSESEDWKFEDEFSYNLLVDSTYSAPDNCIDFPGEVLCETPELVDEFPTGTNGEKLEEKSWISNMDEIDGVDCIWSCVLNQPLSTGTTTGTGSIQKEYRVR
ncbi:hypothetical protein BVC80_9059g30 [Macleaya cordata]|uniref:Uncharacterized protein n=1 Tax=Macleaya cordata TaxID=56857 RepID=A0A200RAH8_MACCD|nr:hypothetical protein BVC80_9059g30 [Macleaya cordata]